MTVEEFLQPPSHDNPCPIKIDNTFWLRRLREAIETKAGQQVALDAASLQVDELNLKIKGLEERLRQAYEALAARVIAAEKVVGTRPAKKKRAAKKRTRPAPRGVVESG